MGRFLPSPLTHSSGEFKHSPPPKKKTHTHTQSPSVLDRLKALLEPGGGGVLTINERGVIQCRWGNPLHQPSPTVQVSLNTPPPHTHTHNLTLSYLGGGGVNLTPPLYEIRDCLATAADRDAPFHDFFLSSLTHLLIPSLRKSDLRSRGHMTFCTLTSAQNLPKICILHMFVYKTHGNY